MLGLLRIASLVATGLTLGLALACGGAVVSDAPAATNEIAQEGAETPNEPTLSVETPRPTVTPRPPATPTPAVTAPATGSDVATITAPAHPPDPDGQDGEGNGQEPQSQPDAPAAPEPAPSPTPARFRPVPPPSAVDLPGGSGGVPIFSFGAGPRIHNYVLSLSGTITDRPDLASARWTVQVWQADYPVDLTTDCSTEKPVAFIMPPTGSGSAFVPVSSPYQWTYCVQGQGFTRAVEVPWLRAESWSLTERTRQRTSQPRIWDFSVSADLDDERVAALEYYRPEGWTILIWAGETLVAREWIEY